MEPSRLQCLRKLWLTYECFDDWVAPTLPYSLEYLSAARNLKDVTVYVPDGDWFVIPEYPDDWQNQVQVPRYHEPHQLPGIGFLVRLLQAAQALSLIHI